MLSEGSTWVRSDYISYIKSSFFLCFIRLHIPQHWQPLSAAKPLQPPELGLWWPKMKMKTKLLSLSEVFLLSDILGKEIRLIQVVSSRTISFKISLAHGTHVLTETSQSVTSTQIAFGIFNSRIPFSQPTASHFQLEWRTQFTRQRAQI